MNEPEATPVVLEKVKEAQPVTAKMDRFLIEVR